MKPTPPGWPRISSALYYEHPNQAISWLCLLSAPSLGHSELMSIDGTLAALADPTRRGVVDLLRERPHRAGDLAQALAVTPPALSRQPRSLQTHEAGRRAASGRN
jgi:hypothetical protein